MFAIFIGLNAVQNSAESLLNVVQNSAQSWLNVVQNSAESLLNAVQNSTESLLNAVQNSAESLLYAIRNSAEKSLADRISHMHIRLIRRFKKIPTIKIHDVKQNKYNGNKTSQDRFHRLL